MKITYPFFLGNAPRYYYVLEQDFGFLDEIFEQIMVAERQAGVPAWKQWVKQFTSH